MKIKKVLNKRNKIVKPLKNRNNVKKMNIIVNKKSVVKKRRLKDSNPNPAPNPDNNYNTN